MSIPIVLFHKNDSYYLEYALRAAIKNNDDVTLITDIKHNKYNNLVKVVNVDNYQNESSVTFSRVYKHMSTNKFLFEYNAIDKFFFMFEHMKKNKLKKILYVDSDVIIHEDLSKIVDEHYADFDVCSCIYDQKYEDLLWVASAHMLLCTYEVLEAFCKFIIDIYSSEDSELNLKWKWHQENNIPGGINDMTLLYLFQIKSDLKVGNFLTVIDNSLCFDLSINTGTNLYKDEYKTQYSFLLDRQIKKLIFRNKQVFVYNKILKKEIRFCISHCQSDAKRIMQLLVKDKRNLSQLISDYIVTLKLFYSAIRRTLSNLKHLK